MARVLDLNVVQSSLMDLILQDEARTVVHLDIPTEELVQEFEAMLPRLDTLKKGDRSAVNEIYNVAAKLISVNLDFFEVTGQELRTTYRMNVLSAINFFGAYLDALETLTKEKN